MSPRNFAKSWMLLCMLIRECLAMVFWRKTSGTVAKIFRKIWICCLLWVIWRVQTMFPAKWIRSSCRNFERRWNALIIRGRVYPRPTEFFWEKIINLTLCVRENLCMDFQFGKIWLALCVRWWIFFRESFKLIIWKREIPLGTVRLLWFRTIWLP